MKKDRINDFDYEEMHEEDYDPCDDLLEPDYYSCTVCGNTQLEKGMGYGCNKCGLFNVLQEEFF